MPALGGQRERHDDDVRDPGRDLLVAAGADVGLARRDRLDATDLGRRPRQGVEREPCGSRRPRERSLAFRPPRAGAVAPRMRGARRKALCGHTASIPRGDGTPVATAPAAPWRDGSVR